MNAAVPYANLLLSPSIKLSCIIFFPLLNWPDEERGRGEEETRNCPHGRQFEPHKSSNQLISRSRDEHRENKKKGRSWSITSLVWPFWLCLWDDCTGVDHCKHTLKRCGFQLSGTGVHQAKNTSLSRAAGTVRRHVPTIEDNKEKRQTL